MNLVRDVLDKKVIDFAGRDMGRVDNIVLEVGRDEPPRVAAIEIGPAVLAHRVWPFLGRYVAGLEHAFRVSEGRPLRIPFNDIVEIKEQVKVDRAFDETSAATVEHRLRAWVSRIPTPW